jgi:DNA-binding NtrC family response regulator
MAAARILIVDDEPDIRRLIGEILADEGHDVMMAADAQQARELRAQQRPDLVLLDVWMPGTDGISLLREWQEAGSLGCPVLMISGHGSVEAAVEATRLGALDFIEKPVSMARLLAMVNAALEHGRVATDEADASRRARAAQQPLIEPTGRSEAAQLLRRQLKQIAEHDAAVLITGEVGVGKELAARWIHAHSSRASGPFVNAGRATDGAAWVKLLLGQGDDQPGVLAQAQGGVLFLPAITEMAPLAQAALLRVLEAGRLNPDEATGTELNVRIIAAAEERMDERMAAGQFDEHLFFHLAVLPLSMQPLRARRDDLPDLVRFYAEYYPAHEGLPYRQFSVAAQNRLREFDWPGNVRQLKNVMQRLLVLGGDQEVSVAEVDAVLSQMTSDTQTPAGQLSGMLALPLREAREEFERAYLTARLKQAKGSVGKLAELIEMERTHLYRKLRQLGIDPRKAQA